MTDGSFNAQALIEAAGSDNGWAINGQALNTALLQPLSISYQELPSSLLRLNNGPQYVLPTYFQTPNPSLKVDAITRLKSFEFIIENRSGVPISLVAGQNWVFDGITICPDCYVVIRVLESGRNAFGFVLASMQPGAMTDPLASVPIESWGAGTGRVIFGNRNVVVGHLAETTGANATAVGTRSLAQVNGTALGESSASQANSLASGQSATAGGEFSVALGRSATTIQDSSVACGAQSVADLQSVAVGRESRADIDSVAMGYRAAAGDNAVAAGSLTAAEGPRSVALGWQAGALLAATKGVALGSQTIVGADSSIGIGQNIANSVPNSALIGNKASVLEEFNHISEVTGFFRSNRQVAAVAGRIPTEPAQVVVGPGPATLTLSSTRFEFFPPTEVTSVDIPGNRIFLGGVRDRGNSFLVTVTIEGTVSSNSQWRINLIWNFFSGAPTSARVGGASEQTTAGAGISNCLTVTTIINVVSPAPLRDWVSVTIERVQGAGDFSATLYRLGVFKIN